MSIIFDGEPWIKNGRHGVFKKHWSSTNIGLFTTLPFYSATIEKMSGNCNIEMTLGEDLNVDGKYEPKLSGVIKKVSTKNGARKNIILTPFMGLGYRKTYYMLVTLLGEPKGCKFAYHTREWDAWDAYVRNGIVISLQLSLRDVPKHLLGIKEKDLKELNKTVIGKAVQEVISGYIVGMMSLIKGDNTGKTYQDNLIDNLTNQLSLRLEENGFLRANALVFSNMAKEGLKKLYEPIFHKKIIAISCGKLKPEAVKRLGIRKCE